MRHKTGKLALLALTAPGLLLAASVVTETFDAGPEGFAAGTTATQQAWAANGGNPGGHIQLRRILDEPFFDLSTVTVDPAFTGNYAAGGITTAFVDLNFLTENITGAWLRFRIDAGSNGWLFPLTGAFPTNVWNTYSATFNPLWSDLEARAAGWLTDSDLNPLSLPSPAFADVMTSVGRLEVRIGSTDASTLAAVDNVGLSDVPEPSGIVMVFGALALLAGRRRMLNR